MNNKELQSETELQQSENVELLTSATLAAKPLLAAVLSTCCTAETLMFVALFILKIWIENDWWINRLLLTNLVLFFATLIFSAAIRASKE